MDAKEQLAEFKANVEKLYFMVEEYIEGTGLSSKRESIIVHEMIPGEYGIDKLLFFHGDELVVSFRPVGGWVLAADGRVNVYGVQRQTLLYLKNARTGTTIISPVPGESKITKETTVERPLYKGFEQEGWYWSRDIQLMRVAPLTKEHFYELLYVAGDYDATGQLA